MNDRYIDEPESDEPEFDESESDEEYDYSHFDDAPISIPNQVFPISGNKVESLLVNDKSLRLLGKHPRSPEEFEAAWKKKWTTAAKLKVSHKSIRSITKEDDELKIRIVYRTYIGIPSECEFSFYDPAVADAFLTYMEKEQYFTYTHGQMGGFGAVWRYILGLTFTIAMTATCCYLLDDEKQGGTGGSGDFKERIFMYLLNLLGKKGIIALGVATCAYIGVKIWKRAANPPFQTKLIRP